MERNDEALCHHRNGPRPCRDDLVHPDRRARYPIWNSTVEKIIGRIAFGEKVTVHAKATPGRAFSLTVTAFEPSHRMVWTGGMPF